MNVAELRIALSQLADDMEIWQYDFDAYYGSEPTADLVVVSCPCEENPQQQVAVLASETVKREDILRSVWP